MTHQQATDTTALDVEGMSIADAEERGAYWLEDTRHFSRYWIGGEESAWACRDCGMFVADRDADEGCEHCGFGAYRAA